MRQFPALLAAAAALFAQTPRPPGLYAVFHTSLGDIAARLYEKETPLTVKNFVALARGEKPWRDPATRSAVKRPLYSHIRFHRVLQGEMIQAGDPTGRGDHNCGVTIRDEFLPGLRFDRPGRLAMANTGEPDSGGCQFFITEQMMPVWNGKYTIFGQVTSGMDVVNKISHRRAGEVELTGVSIERN